MNLAEELLEAFTGFSTAHGQTEVSQERTAGKQKAKSFIVRNPLTLQLIKVTSTAKKVLVLFLLMKKTNVGLVLWI